MIDDHPDLQKQSPSSGKLVLPAYSEEPYPPSAHAYKPHIRSEHPTRHLASPVPRNPLAKHGYLWQSDPAYKVLLIAIVMVLIAGGVFVTLASNMLGQMYSTFTPTQNSSLGATPQSVVDMRPIFPTPHGGQGSTESSQPLQNLTPSTMPTTTTQPPQGEPLALQITNAPQAVINDTDAFIGVNTNTQGVDVRLVVTYDTLPSLYISDVQTTDANGNATLLWHIHTTMHGGNMTVAHIIATAQDQNGQQTTSQIVTIQIL